MENSNSPQWLAFFAQDEIPPVLSSERTGLRQIAHAFATTSDDTFTPFFD